VQRGPDKRAPFHRSRKGVANALLIELYATAIDRADLANEPHAFVTTNSEDFSQPQGDNRLPHPDLATLFGSEGSDFGLGVYGLNGILLAHFGQEIEELFAETYLEEEPRRLDEITAAEHEMFDASGITDPSSTSSGCWTMVTVKRSSGCAQSPGRGERASRRPTHSPDSSARAQISSWGCSTGGFQRSVGSWALNGNSWTRMLSCRMSDAWHFETQMIFSLSSSLSSPSSAPVRRRLRNALTCRNVCH